MTLQVAIEQDKCFWCRERKADSREHKFKRSDLLREHGRGALRDERTLVGYRGGDSWEMRSTKNDGLKFRPSLCSYCNNTRSQAFDLAYDQFIKWVLAHEDDVIKAREIDLAVVLGSNWQAIGEDVLRYFVKAACCRIVEAHRGNGKAKLPADAIEFLNGGSIPLSLGCEMWIEPTWLRFCDLGEGDPIWVRPMGLEPIYLGPGMRVASRWSYGWLVFGWEFWAELGPENPFATQRLSMPIVATRSVDFEFALMPTSAHRPAVAGDLDMEWLERIGGGETIAPDGLLARSGVGQRFVGGALDFEGTLRDRGPDRREFIVDAPAAGIETEAERCTLLCGVARSVWGQGSIDIARIRSIQPQDDPLAIMREVEALRSHRPDEGLGALCNDFAALASLKLIEAIHQGVNNDTGHSSLLDAADLAGRSAVAAGSALGDDAATWDAVNAAVAQMVRTG